MYYTYEACYKKAKKYEYLSDFKNCKKTYEASMSNGWIDSFDWLKINKPRKCKWTYEACYQEAKKYKSKKDFYTYSPKAYQKACISKWYNDYKWLEKSISHLESVYKKYNLPKKWNIYENCMEESKKYSSRKDFNNGSPNAYYSSLKNNWINNFDWLEKPFNSKIKWDYERCKEEAKKYTSRGELCKNNPTVYIKLLNTKWIDSFEWLENKKEYPNKKTKWDYDTCYKEAKKYLIKGDFIKNSWTAYCISSRNKWLKDFTWLKKHHN